MARLLLVDDDPRVRYALAALLASSLRIREVVACSHADEAEIVASAAEPDIARVDVLLPGRDDRLRLIRAMQATYVNSPPPAGPKR